MARLTNEEVVAAINLHSSDLIGEVYEMVQSYMKAEQSRQTIIESKATALLSAVGLVSTLAFAFAGNLLERHTAMDSMPTSSKWAIVALLIAASVFAILSGINAILALLVKSKQLVPNEHAIFNSAALQIADKSNEDAVRDYRRFLLPHLWQIAQLETEVLNKKGLRVALGQKLFLGFVACVGMLAVFTSGRLAIALGLL